MTHDVDARVGFGEMAHLHGCEEDGMRQQDRTGSENDSASAIPAPMHRMQDVAEPATGEERPRALTVAELLENIEYSVDRALENAALIDGDHAWNLGYSTTTGLLFDLKRAKGNVQILRESERKLRA